DARAVIGKTGDLLDVGTGRGDILKAAGEHGWKAIGIEVTNSFADYAERYAKTTVLRKPLLECGFPSGSFDAVVLAGVLEHLYAPHEVIAEIARVLRPGGALYLDVPNE